MKKIFLFLSVILLSSLKAMAAEPYALLSDNNTKLTFYYGTKPANGMSVGPFTIYEDRGWNSAAATITTIEFHSSMADCNTITSTAYWFYNLVNLTTITGIDNLNTANVTNMRYMFWSCENLKSLVLSRFDTGNVTNMGEMFAGCSGLTSLDVSGFDTGKVTVMYSMFSSCFSLTSLDLSGFDTGKVTNMYSMFSGCFSLTSLDVSGFDTGNVTTMWMMFFGCSSLETIYCNDTWNPNTSSLEMFTGCTSLVGGTGTTYNSQNVDAAYAHPNAGGYFTKKGLLGDVNSDGKVTPADAIMILYHYFGVAQTGFNESVADVNDDKKISPADAIEALYIYFGSSSGGNARATLPATVSSRDPE